MNEEARNQSPGPSAEQGQPSTGVAEMPIRSGPGGCTLVEISGSGGTRFECRGGCGFVDRFFGRSCTKVVQNAGGGVQVFCTCSGGWFDRLTGG
jgi:hypothetical protein